MRFYDAVELLLFFTNARHYLILIFHENLCRVGLFCLWFFEVKVIFESAQVLFFSSTPSLLYTSLSFIFILIFFLNHL